MKSANPRRVAFDILHRVEAERSFADLLLDHALAKDGLIGPDRGLLTELVYGVLRRQGTLDHVIDQLASQPVRRLERAVHLLLRLGLYQLLFLDRVPAAAAVHETVELAKTLAPRAAGFINAVLRRADRERGVIRYPDRERDLAGYLAAFHSHPRWLMERWLAQLGPAEAEALAVAMAEPPPLTLRVNTLRTDRSSLLARLAAEGIGAEPTRFSPDGFHLPGRGAIAGLDWFREGLATVQDESSQVAAHLLAPQPGERLLDLCAAPGGKATHLAQLMGDEGRIVACDRSPRKLRQVVDNATRLGIVSLAVMACDAYRPPRELVGEGFDRVLVDAPCSGLGVIRRNPEGKWRLTPVQLTELQQRQATILGNAAELVRPGGILLYATCSTAQEEDEVVVEEFLSRQGGFVVEDLRELFPAWEELFSEQGFFRSWPHRHGGMDGFFAARLRRT